MPDTEAQLSTLRAEVDQIQAQMRDHLHGADETTRQLFGILGLAMAPGLVALGLAGYLLWHHLTAGGG